jgi:flavorubredoxin
VGTLDPDLRHFDVIMQAEHGTTYNSYLVVGDDKVALIDTSKGRFADDYIERLRKVIDPAKIDYIVMNHMEPDHSGALAKVLEAAPNATPVLTRPGYQFAKNIVNFEFDAMIIKGDEVLDLGGRSLRFIVAPYLHWPDTMFTYCEEDGVLFTCDFLGAHYCDERLFSDLVENYDYSFKYYFQCIMRPFKEYVRDGLDKIDALEGLKVICPSHGPVLRSNLESYIARYREWSAEPPAREAKRLLVFYASAYGNTRKMAQEISEGAKDAGADVSLLDLEGVELSMMVDEIENADGVAIGSCTINGDALEHTWSLLSSLATIKLKKKLGAAFGSYGWSGEGPKMLAERMKSLKFRVPEEPLRIKVVPTEDDLTECREYGRKLAEAL